MAVEIYLEMLRYFDWQKHDEQSQGRLRAEALPSLLEFTWQYVEDYNEL